MPIFSVTDSLNSPLAGVKIDLSQPSSLVQYAKSEALHLAVAPDFVAHQNELLTQAAAQPLSFNLKLGNLFELGGLNPEITLTPKVEAVLRLNTTEGADLFDDEAFHRAAEVPAGTAYAGLAFTGDLDLGVSGIAGNLTFGLNADAAVTFEFLKAFPTGAGQPTLGAAAGQVLSGYLIPASIDDLKRMQVHDICTVSGQGSVLVSGGFDIALPVNPLASVNLPVGAGSLTVQHGVMAGVTLAFTISGAYQVRARRLPAGTIELSYLRESGTEVAVDFDASASLIAKLNRTELLETLLKAISKAPPDPELLKSLTTGEIASFTGAIEEGVSHSLEASLDLILSQATDNQAAFQYELDLDALDDASSSAVNRALRGDLRALTAFEHPSAIGGIIAPGVKLLDSVLSRTRTNGVTLRVNLLGIVNLLSISKLVSNCEFLVEPASGDLTIKETAQSDRISAITDMLRKQEALRKALFESVLVTTTYRAGRAVALPGLDCHCLHFVLNRGTDAAHVSGYIDWLRILGLVTPAEAPGLLAQYNGDKTSTCVLRTALDDATCLQLFFDGAVLRDKSYYLEFGRKALHALLADSCDDAGRARYRVLDEPARWAKALEDGPSPALREIVPLDRSNPQFDLALNLIVGDVYDIVWWARSMTAAGASLNAMRQYLAGRDPGTLTGDPDFIAHRDALQKTMLKVVAESKTRFDQPWGLIALYWAAGTPPTASGKIAAGALTLSRAQTETGLAATL
jgi:hypothetical protein